VILGDCVKSEKTAHFDSPLPWTRELRTASFTDEAEGNLRKLLNVWLLKEAGELKIEIRDYSSESIINGMLPMFLRKQGINLLVFDAHRIVHESDVVLDELEVNFHSLVSALLRDANELVAPFAFVGTVSGGSPCDLVTVSKLLQTRFSAHEMWSSNIIVCRSNEILSPFFPINFSDDIDCGAERLKEAIVEKFRSSLALHTKVTIAVVDLLTKIRTTKYSHISIDEAYRWAGTSGIQENEIEAALTFLHSFGEISWFPQEPLRSLVVLKPIQFFYYPFSRILCQNYRGGAKMKYHEEFYIRRKEPYEAYTMKGIIREKLLAHFMDDYRSRSSSVISMLYSLNLLVRCHHSYCLIPTLLPYHAVSSRCTVAPDATSFFMFITDSSEHGQPHMFADSGHSYDGNQMDFRDLGLCPSGSFDQFVAKITNNQQQDNYFRQCSMSRDRVSFFTCGQRVDVLHRRSHNCFQVNIYGPNQYPWKIYRRFDRQLRALLAESFPALSCCSYVTNLHPTASKANANDTVFVKVDALYDETCGPNPFDQSPINLQIPETWQQPSYQCDCYDVFISYRWDDNNDDVVITGIISALENHRRDVRGVDVFLDRFCISSGEDFQRAYFGALHSSTVMLPIVSLHALESMMKHDPEIVDNILVEWFAALNMVPCRGNSKIRLIYPIFVGDISKRFISKLPDILPSATILKVTELLNRAGMKEPVVALSVRKIVEQIFCFSGFIFKSDAFTEKQFKECSIVVRQLLSNPWLGTTLPLSPSSVSAVSPLPLSPSSATNAASPSIMPAKFVPPFKMRKYFADWSLLKYIDEFEDEGFDIETLLDADLSTPTAFCAYFDLIDLSITKENIAMIRLRKNLRKLQIELRA
jgi:hypothetical protein